MNTDISKKEGNREFVCSRQYRPWINIDRIMCFSFFVVLNSTVVGHGGLGVTCSPRDPRFAGSNPAEVDEFFQDVKILSTSPPGGILSWGSRV